MKIAVLGSLVLVALCASLTARSDDDADTFVLVCGSSLATPGVVQTGHTVTVGTYETKQEAIDALEAASQFVGDQLAADALAGISCDACEFTEDGRCPGEVDCQGWDETSVTTHVSFDEATQLWTAYAEVRNDIYFGLTCNECVPE